MTSVRRIQVAFALGGLVLLAMAVVAIVRAREFQETNREVRETKRIQTQLTEILSTIKDLETGSRGYLLAGNEEFLEHYHGGLVELPKMISALKASLGPDDRLLSQFTAVEPLIADKLAEMAGAHRTYLEQGQAAAAARVASTRGKQLMDAIRQKFAEMQADEARLLEARLEESAADARDAVIPISGGFLFGFVFFGGAYYFMRRDHRAREKAAAESQRQHQQITDLYNKAPCGYQSLAPDGTFLAVNDTELAWLGYLREELVGKKSFADILTPEARVQFTDVYFPRFKAQGRVDDLEFDLVRRDGTLQPVALSAIAVYDETGVFISSRSTLFDITERRRLRQVHEQARAFAESVVQNVPEPIVILDAHFLIVSANSSFFSTFQTTPSAALNQPLQRLGGDEWNAAFQAALARVLETQETLNDFELTLKSSIFGRKVLLVNASTLQRPDQESPLILLALKDITARTQATEEIAQLHAEADERAKLLAAANAELEAFSYTVSHDLRAPLRHMAGYSQMLEKHAAATLDERGQRYLKVIGDSAREMGVLIDELLAFAGLGRAQLKWQDVCLNEIVHDVKSRLVSQSPDRRIVWTISELPSVQGDPSLLRQVFANLLGNAVKYTGKRAEAHIEVALTRSETHETTVTVRDNGAGFDMKYADKLFGVFQRLHGAAEFEGNGIGLATVRRILERHGARIRAEAEPNVGAAFHVTFSSSRSTPPFAR